MRSQIGKFQVGTEKNQRMERRERTAGGSMVYRSWRPEKHFMSPKRFVSEVNRISRVAERLLRDSRSFQEFVKVMSKYLSRECAIATPFYGTVKFVCRTRPSVVQGIHHLRESPMRNWLRERAVLQPMLEQRAYLEYAMDHCFTTHPHVNDRL